MSKDRNTLCAHYQYCGSCAITKKECTVQGEMQHCSKYEAAKDRKPYRTNRRNERREKERNRYRDI